MEDHFSFMDNVRLIIIIALFIVTGVVIFYFRLKRATGKKEGKKMARAEDLKGRNRVVQGTSPDRFKPKEKEEAKREESVKGGKIDQGLNSGAEPNSDLQETLSISKEDLDAEIEKKLQDVFCKIEEREQIVIEKMTSIMEARFKEILNGIDSVGEGAGELPRNVKKNKTKNQPETKKQKPKMRNQLPQRNKKEDAKDVFGVVRGKGGRKIDKRKNVEYNEDFDIHKFLDELEEPNTGKEAKSDIDINEKDR